jgi:general secretion pathway protein J
MKVANIDGPDAGFTLVEMLVALVIFSLMAAAGVGLLRSSVDLQGVVNHRLAGLSSVARLDNLLASDLRQVLNRPSRAPDGLRPAFVGTTTSMQLVAGGWQNLDDEPRSDLRRVEWTGGPDGLARTSFPSVDGTDAGALTATLARDYPGVRLRYRLANGSWATAFSSSAEEPLPAAVEVRLEPRGGPPLELLYQLPVGAVDRKPPSPEQPA